MYIILLVLSLSLVSPLVESQLRTATFGYSNNFAPPAGRFESFTPSSIGFSSFQKTPSGSYDFSRLSQVGSSGSPFQSYKPSSFGKNSASSSNIGSYDFSRLSGSPTSSFDWYKPNYFGKYSPSSSNLGSYDFSRLSQVGSSGSPFQSYQPSSFGRYSASSANTDGSLSGTGTTVDPVLREQLRNHEGSRRSVYRDTRNHPTVGVGFNLDRRDAPDALRAVGADYNAIRANRDQLTENQINQLLDADIQTARNTARNFYSGYNQLDPVRQRVLTNMAFNMGGGTLGRFRNFHNALEQGDYERAAEEMLDSRWAEQVGNRANELAEQMRTGE